MKLSLLKSLLAVTGSISLAYHSFGEADPAGEASLSGLDTFWGTMTNGITPALHVEPDFINPMQLRCTPVLKNDHTNILILYFPPLNNRFIMELKDAQGRPVPKTQKGKALNETLTEPFGMTIGINARAGYSRLPPLDPNYSSMESGFDFILQDYFVITNSGAYDLSFQMNVIWFSPEWKGPIRPKSTNVPVVNLPPIQAKVQIRLAKPFPK